MLPKPIESLSACGCNRREAKRHNFFKFYGVKFVNLTSNFNVKRQGEVSQDDFSSFEAKLSVR